MSSVKPAQSPYSLLHPIRGLERIAAQNKGIRVLGQAAKYLTPVISTGLAATLYLNDPAAATWEGLIFYASLAGAAGTVASRGLSKSFRLAGAERRLSEAGRRIDKLELKIRLTSVDKLNDGDEFKIANDRFKLKRRLTGGGMAAVFVFSKFTFDFFRDMVFKFPLPGILADKGEMERFTGSEAQAMSGLSHANIVTYYDGGFVPLDLYERLVGKLDKWDGWPDQIPYIAMEYVEGRPLEEIIQEKIEKRETLGLGIDEAIGFALDVARALEYALRTNAVIHRDLKPGNFFVVDGRQSGTKEIKVGDFGLAKIGSKKKLTAVGLAMGTPEYMSPEQWQGKPEIDWRTDQYALGIILYEMLTLKPPFGFSSDVGDVWAYQNLVLKQPLPDIRAERPDIPDDLVGIINKMLEKERDKRYQNWGDCIKVLERARERYPRL